MFQVLVLISVICLVYLIARLSSSKKAISNESTEMVKCKTCDLNLPKTDATNANGEWYCSKEHIN